MDTEKQPLLNRPSPNVRHRTFRALTTEEVLEAHQDVTWRRARFFLIIMFWALMVMMLSIVACIVVSAPSCNAVDKGADVPYIPPVHLTMAPLVSVSRAVNGV